MNQGKDNSEAKVIPASSNSVKCLCHIIRIGSFESRSSIAINHRSLILMKVAEISFVLALSWRNNTTIPRSCIVLRVELGCR